MKLRFILLLPLLLASCSDLTPKEQPTAAPPIPKVSPPAPAPTLVGLPAPALEPPLRSTNPGPENPLGFLDPDTTGELMTDAKKKTITSANANLAPVPVVEGDSAINVDPPKLPEVTD